MNLARLLRKVPAVVAGIIYSLLLIDFSIVVVLYLTKPYFQLPDFFQWSTFVDPNFLVLALPYSSGVFFAIQYYQSRFEDSDDEVREWFEEVTPDLN